MNILNADINIKTFIAGTGGVANGDLVVWSSGKVVKAAAAAGAGTIVGIAQATVDADALVGVAIIKSGDIIEAVYTGSSKTSLADTDFGTIFDTTGPTTVDLDDTTDGYCVCVGYDNTVNLIKFMVAAADLLF